MHSSSKNEALLIELSPLKEDAGKQSLQDTNEPQTGGIEDAGGSELSKARTIIEMAF